MCSSACDGLAPGRYGGGDDIRFGRVILCVDLPEQNIPRALRQRVVAEAQAAVEVYTSLGDDCPVRLGAAPSAPDDPTWKWHLRLTILSHVCLDAPVALWAVR